MSTLTVSTSPEETARFGRELAPSLSGGDMVLLRGEIGTGKSVLAKGIGEGFAAVGWRGSPTFTLVHEYATVPRLIHIDLYRLAATDLDDLGLDEYIDRETVTLVEWADRAPAYLADMATHEPKWIDIVIGEDDERMLFCHRPSRIEPPFGTQD